jgi:hypothetical protein
MEGKSKKRRINLKFLHFSLSLLLLLFSFHLF